MESLVMAGQLILALSILVIIHELGHFLAARAFGIKVEKFYLFFDVGGVKLFSYKRGDVEYGIGWLPLGGYVKITGMIDESMDKEAAQRDPEPYEFRAKPAWQRLIVMLGGIIMNVLLGILIFTLHTAYYGEKYIPASELKNGIEAHSLGQKVGFQTGDIITSVNGEKPKKASDIINTSLILDKNVVYTVERNGQQKTIQLPSDFGRTILNTGLDSFLSLRYTFTVDKVAEKSNAEKAGLKAGDKIVSVNDTAVPFFNQFSPIVKHNKNKQVKLGVQRGNEIINLNAAVDSNGAIGFIPEFKTETERYSFGQALARGPEKAYTAIAENAKGLWRLISGDLPANKSLHGVIGIAHIFGGQWDWQSFWGLTGMLSMVLAIMNLLPIPALDGGHVIFLLVEMLRGKPLSIKFLEMAQMVGMALLFLLMGYALYNDFATFIFK
jgi:regulator of sigma E protease